jgi:hypothetical protein
MGRETKREGAGMKPEIGMTMKVYGMVCVIVAIHRAGTLDVDAPNGKRYRITGLCF